LIFLVPLVSEMIKELAPTMLFPLSLVDPDIAIRASLVKVPVGSESVQSS
jgi:hypothetical protein